MKGEKDWSDSESRGSAGGDSNGTGRADCAHRQITESKGHSRSGAGTGNPMNIFETIRKATSRIEPIHSSFLAHMLRESLSTDRRLFEHVWGLVAPQDWEVPERAHIATEDVLSGRRIRFPAGHGLERHGGIQGDHGVGAGIGRLFASLTRTRGTAGYARARQTRLDPIAIQTVVAISVDSAASPAARIRRFIT